MIRHFTRRAYRTLAVFLLLAACRLERDLGTTYKPYLAYFDVPTDPRLLSLKERMGAIPDPVLQFSAVFDSSWNFSLGKKTETFQASSIVVKGTSVNLPHRLLHPDQAFWYSKTLVIDQPGVLTIHADDGAQLFIGGKLVRRLDDKYFPVDTVGKIQVTIRVLNNAMAGGLRHVEFSTHDQFNTYKRHQQLHRRQQTLVEKIILMDAPTTEMTQLVVKAIREGNEVSLMAAEKEMEAYPFLIGPWLQQRDSGTTIITVESDGKYPVRLRYGVGKESIEVERMGEEGIVSFELRGLQPDTVYHYMLTSGMTVSPVYTFKTMQNPDHFTFNVWADSQSGWDGFEQHMRNMSEHDDAFGVGAGDLVANGSNREEWRRLFKTLAVSAASRPYYLVPGNHDYDGYYDDLNPANYKRYVRPANYFSWTYGNCAFIALDPNEQFPIGIQSAQHRWFHDQIQSEAWRKAKWHFVFLHQPPVSQGWAGYQGDAVIRELLEPVIESAGIDFIIAGHTHDYERLTKTYGNQQATFLIVGGGGGSLEPPESSAEPVMDTLLKVHHMGRFYVQKHIIRFEAIDLQKKVIDAFEQRK